jgi:tetratricopeptide (TPR) repeat protein
MNEPGQAPLPVQGKGAGEKGTDRDYPPLIVLGIALIALVIAGYGLVREMAKEAPFNPLQELSDKIGDAGDDIMGKLRGLTGKGGVPDSVRQGRRHVRRGFELYKKGKTGGALAEYEEALKLDPRNPDAWFWRGRVFLVQKDLDRALSDFERTLLLKPDHVSAHDNMGWIYTQKGDREKAIHHLTQAIRLKPDNAWAYFNRGRLLFQKGEKEAALRDSQKACDLGHEKACQVVKQFKKK